MRDFPSSLPAIIIPCYNRREVTLGCLALLRSTGVLDQFLIIVVDDASTDGTANAVRTNYPDVRVLESSGDLFWTGAVSLGMASAMESGAPAMVWINDDTVIHPGAIEAITAKALEIEGVASGQGIIGFDKENPLAWFPLYFRNRTGLTQVPVDRAQVQLSADTCRGNLVAISRKVVDSIGYPDAKWMPHFNGDTDYGLRATSAGFPLVVLPAALVNETEIIRNDNVSWLLGSVGIFSQWKRAFHKRSPLYPPMQLMYCCRHWGLPGFLMFVAKYGKLLCITVLICLLPKTLRIKLFGSYSHSYQVSK